MEHLYLKEHIKLDFSAILREVAKKSSFLSGRATRPRGVVLKKRTIFAASLMYVGMHFRIMF